jgi:hypothetical protein
MRGMVKISRDHLHKGGLTPTAGRIPEVWVTTTVTSPFATKAWRSQAPLPCGLQAQQGRHSGKVERIEYDPTARPNIA